MHLGRRYKERTESGWSEVKWLDPPFDDLPIMRLTASSKGTYFFDEFKPDFTGDIRYSRLVDGKHEEPQLLNKNINSGKSFHPFIAPDESYLIFDSERAMVIQTFISVSNNKMVRGVMPSIWVSK